MSRRLTRKQKAATVIGAAALVTVAGGGVALASSDDDATDTPIEGASLEQAEQAALAETGGGRVTGTEIEDEESYYEVEVTREDGSQVDVQLDRDFQVVGSEDETEGEDD